jgi:hypothetical protein
MLQAGKSYARLLFPGGLCQLCVCVVTGPWEMHQDGHRHQRELRRTASRAEYAALLTELMVDGNRLGSRFEGLLDQSFEANTFTTNPQAAQALESVVANAWGRH